MTERYRRNNQSDAERGWDQNWQNPRQQQQFHDEDYRQSGGYDDMGRNRWESQQGGDYYSNADRDNRDHGFGQNRNRSAGYAGTGYGREAYGRSDYRDQGRFSNNDRYEDRQDRDYQGTMRAGQYGGAFADRDRGSRGYAGSYGYGENAYGAGSNRFDSFTGNDYGGRDFARGSNALYGGSYGRASDRGDYSGWRDYGESRGFLDKAGDEIASWFGDEDAARRRRQDHRGRGPEGYTRSDERIREDVNDALTHDWAVDASKVTVRVDNGEVTLEGTVPSRTAKRKAEDCADDVAGVKHVQNNLRVQDHAVGSSTTMSTGSAGTTTGSVTSSATGSTGATRTTR